MKKQLLLLPLMLISLFSVSSCTEASSSSISNIEITDMIGRKVNVPTTINKVICIGAGSLRLYSYLGDLTKLSGVEDIEKTRMGKVSIRPYQITNETLFSTLPSCGIGGPTGSADAEKILTCRPDIIFSLYTSDVSAMDNLQSSTGITVVTLSYGDSAPFNDVLSKSINLMGKILGKEERATSLNTYIQGVKDDIANRTKDVEEKPSVYLGCNSFYGTHGFESTSASYSIFNVGNIKNATSEYLTSHTDLTAASLDMEAIVDMNPDKIILDVGGISVLKTQYADSTKKALIDSLSAVKKGEVYLQMPFNAYYTNIELGLCNAYYDASVVYKDKFNDVNVEDEVNEILKEFLGSSCYSEIKKEMNGGYQQITSLSEFLK